jgi:hypothetical protein
MEIVLEVSISTTGRVSGRARPTGEAEWTPFSGAMELMACIEQLCHNGTQQKEQG